MASGEALRVNAVLKNLDLSYNEIGSDGAKAFAAVLRVDSGLTALRLTYNKIGEETKMELREAVKARPGLRLQGL